MHEIFKNSSIAQCNVYLIKIEFSIEQQKSILDYRVCETLQQSIQRYFFIQQSFSKWIYFCKGSWFQIISCKNVGFFDFLRKKVNVMTYLFLYYTIITQVCLVHIGPIIIIGLCSIIKLLKHKLQKVSGQFKSLHLALYPYQTCTVPVNFHPGAAII